MLHRQPFIRYVGTALALLILIVLALPGTQWTVAAQTDDPAADQAITYVVAAGDTLTRIANRYGVTVDDLVAWNDIVDPDLIFVDQILTLYADQELPTKPDATTEPLTFSWALVDWRPADPDYIATLRLKARGGRPPYTIYHDGLVQEGDTFEIAWRRCRPKPGSVGVTDASGTYVKQDYWLLAPYCPVGIEIVEPAEGAHLKHYPRHFNVLWDHTVDPGPVRYGMEIEVWEHGDYHPWKTYEPFWGETFFVPDVFPGDLAGRVRMWGLYEGKYAGPKTPWRTFEFRVTY